MSAIEEYHGNRFPNGTPVKLHARSRIVTIGDRAVHLTPLEFEVLHALVDSAPDLLSYERLLGTIWGSHATGKISYLKLYIYYLRSKLELDPSNPVLILNERGKGYRLAWPV